MSSFQPFLPRKARKRTEEAGIAIPTRTRPAEECVRFSKFSPTPLQVILNCLFSHAGENFESAALGVECVLRKVRDERQCAATRLARFRYALSNRTRGRFSAFSPCRREATGSLLENGAAKNAYNRAHSFRGFDGSVSVCLDLLDLPLPSAHSVVKKNQEPELLSYHKYRPCG